MLSASNMEIKLEPPKINQRSIFHLNSWLIALALAPMAAPDAEEAVSSLPGYISKMLEMLPILTIPILALELPATPPMSTRIPSRSPAALQLLPTTNQP